MVLKKIKIKNFRSIHDIEVDLNRINAFIGQNNAGKSNILKAIDLIIGPTYPSQRSMDDKDFHNYSSSNPIEIEVLFDNPLTVDPRIEGFRIAYDGNNFEYAPIDRNSNVLTYPRGNREMRVTNEMRNEINLMYLSLDRQAYQQIKASNWTVYGKLLKHISNKISDIKKRDFRTGVEGSYNSHVHEFVDDVETCLKNFVKEQTGLAVNLRLRLIDPTMILKDLRPWICSDCGFETDIEDEGAGIQSAMAIAIARTYAEVVQQPLILAIEEPELFLHPHGCRHFYSILKKLADENIQIFYSTHERSFINIADYKSIHIVKKENSITNVYSGPESISDIEIVKIASKFDEELNELFFAEKIILTEGPDDKIACRLAFEKLGVELDKKNISIADCGGNTGIKPMIEILQQFSLDVKAIVDEDPGNPSTQTIITQITNLLGIENRFIQSPNLEGIFGQTQKFTRERALQILPQWFNTNPVPQVYQNLKNSLNI